MGPGQETEGARSSEETNEALLADYVAAEEALRAFTDRNFGRMCAICARWTLVLARYESEAPATQPGPVSSGLAAATETTWRLSSVVTSCCNANHALESMSERNLAGIVATREEGRAWWQRVKRAQTAACAALTDAGCHLTHGRPELCNKYFCEAIRDYLWLLGGARDGDRLAQQLDGLQTRWSKLYLAYQRAMLEPDAEARRSSQSLRHRVRERGDWEAFFLYLERFDADIARCSRPVTAEDVAARLFKVTGDASLYEPFFNRELTEIGGRIRRPEA